MVTRMSCYVSRDDVAGTSGKLDFGRAIAHQSGGRGEL
jgi:hypothetical protein